MIDINKLRRLALDGDLCAEQELLDRLEAAEKDVALKERVIDALGAELNAVVKERDALRAKVERMEKQEPVGYMPLATKAALEAGGSGVVWHPNDRSVADEPLYTSPGAKGEEK